MIAIVVVFLVMTGRKRFDALGNKTGLVVIVEGEHKELVQVLNSLIGGIGRLRDNTEKVVVVGTGASKLIKLLTFRTFA